MRKHGTGLAYLTSRFWMNMQASYELEVAEDQRGKAVMREVLPRTAA